PRPALVAAAQRVGRDQRPGHRLPTLRRTRLRQPLVTRAKARLHLTLGHIDADNPLTLWHPPTPFLARPGSRAQATVRVKGRHRTCPSLSLRVHLRDTRAQLQRRAVAAQPPVRTFCPIAETQGTG